MENQNHTLMVAPEEVSKAVNEGAIQGWKLIESIPQADGKLLLRFERQSALQPRQYDPRYDPVPHQRVDPNIAWLELIGLMGFLGIGYMVANKVQEGIMRLVLYLVLMTVGWIIVAALSVVLIGLCLIPVMLAIQVAIPVWSALELKKQLEQDRRSV